MEIELVDKIIEAHMEPQFARERIKSLNGVWQCNGHMINVPYAPEAKLSSYEARDQVLDENWDGHLTYENNFELPKEFALPRVLIHFGAVDQVADIYVNGVHVGHHEGGYLSFVLDITDAVKKQQNNVLRVEVVDTLSTEYPYGKQHKHPHGMWYTTVSGIWKSVWLENVPEEYVKKWKIKPSLSSVTFIAKTNMGNTYKKKLEISSPQRWTPDNPKLYPVKVKLGEDVFYSYFALRTINIQNIDGVNRVCLNDKPVFMHGVLDQGYWPEGIYTPPSREAYEQDILAMKNLGFNMLRKHVKVEAPYYYYLCDKLGMMVCQDMVQNGSYSYIRDTALPNLSLKRRKDTRNVKGDESRRKIFIGHCRDTIAEVYNHPSVVMYTIFNEGWGQFQSDRLYELLKELDPDRLFDSTSGWFAQTKSDFDSEHIYFRNKRLHPRVRPMFLKECGGYVLPIENHLWNSDEEYGYGACKSKEQLTAKIEELYEEMVIPAIPKGLCGCVFTQLSDVENEINGLFTYDRKVCKVIEERMRQIAEKVSMDLLF